MSAPIAVYYHAILSSAEREIDPDYAINLIAAQMHALNSSGLTEACQELHVCVNGSESDAMAIASLCPDKAKVTCHGKGSITEIPTLNLLQASLPAHHDWYFMYHHTKGVSTPNQADGWRRRMEFHVVDNWRECVKRLDQGYDACGCHWLTPEANPGTISSPFFGGNFWIAKAKYLLTLPPLPEATWKNRYSAESWIGSAKVRPKVYDSFPGWPTVG